jgi:hypothetical protein
METFYRATGDRHAITIDAPRAGGALKPGDALRGAFYDPPGEIRRLTVRIGEREEVVPFRRGPLWCRFATALDLTDVVAGVRPIGISITSAQLRKCVELSRLVLTDRLVPFAAPDDTVLDIDVGGVDHGAELHVNGAILARLHPTMLKGEHDFPKPVAGTEQRRFVIPRQRLRRLNRIEFRAGSDPEGGVDRFCVLDVRLTSDGHTFRDNRFRHGRENPAYVTAAKVYWIDLLPGQ